MTDQTRVDRTETRRQYLEQHAIVINSDGSEIDWKSANEKTIDHWFGKANDPAKGVPILPMPPGTKGFAEFGEKMGWGRGNAEARARIETLTREELEQKGITKQMAEEWRDFYKSQPVTNPSAAGRADLMQHAADLLGGGK